MTLKIRHSANSAEVFSFWDAPTEVPLVMKGNTLSYFVKPNYWSFEGVTHNSHIVPLLRFTIDSRRSNILMLASSHRYIAEARYTVAPKDTAVAFISE